MPILCESAAAFSASIGISSSEKPELVERRDVEVLGQLVDVFHADLGGLVDGLVRNLETQRLGDSSKALRLAGVVELHDWRQKPAGQRAVRRVVHAARCLAHGVGRAGGIGAVGEARQHGGHAHVVARLEVMALRVGDPQVAAAILHGQQRDRIGERLMVGHRVALDGMGERVHAGPGGDPRREIDTQGWIDERDP